MNTATALLEALEGVCYIVDRQRRITACGGAHWRRFAADNGGPVDPVTVIGRDLFDFVAGERVRACYTDLLERLDAGRLSVASYTYRCDSPSVRREMRMSITALRESDATTGFLFQSVTLNERPRPPIGLFDFARGRARRPDAALPLLGLCSYCQKVRHPAGSVEGEGAWIEAEDYYRLGGSTDVQISHGICEPCFHRAQAEALADLGDLGGG